MTRHVEFQRLHNFRDLGGYPTADGGTTKWGVLYRSDSLGKLREAADVERFRALDVHTVIDLRYPWEIEKAGRVPDFPGLRYVNASIEHQPYDQGALGSDFDPWRFLADRYMEVSQDGVKEIREVLDVIADPESGPTVFHCASGKDRTGIIALYVLTLIGVSEETVLDDFALTELATQRLIADWKAFYPDRELKWPAYARAPKDPLELFIADLKARYGSVEGYAEQELGVDAALVAALKANLVDVEG
ncbi:tyrosine-protein phosphatase [Catenulispora pinisilvae]|uniref:tyrosine-protein phosphatase n=1 Tax=Catenulispora pinisilvae TaxID=2705253 RepID=UPI0018919326|nr:tyrosine-protein phosphatase [Catenulispora pinisilvae]